MKDLPEIYARVCAVRPELAVKSLARDLSVYRAEMLTEDGPIADAIIAKWVKALPVHAELVLGMDNPKDNPRWYVDGPQHLYPCADTPIEALAAFYLEEQP